MKISKLRRTLAVFLSALMLTLCAPMSAFTAAAATEISEIEVSIDSDKVADTAAEGNTIPLMTSRIEGGSGDGQIVNIKTTKLCYAHGWAKFDNGSWSVISGTETFSNDITYGLIFSFLSYFDEGYTFSSNVSFKGIDSNKLVLTGGDSTQKVYVYPLGTIDEINNASGGGGSSTGSTVSVADIISGRVTQLNVGDTVNFDTATVSYDNTGFSVVSLYFDDFSISNHTKDSFSETYWGYVTTYVDVVTGGTRDIVGTHGSYTADAYWAVDAIDIQQGNLFVLLRSDKDTTLGGSSFTYPTTVEDISDVVSIELNEDKTQVVITVPDSDHYDYYYQTTDYDQTLHYTPVMAQSDLDGASKIGMEAGTTTFPATTHTIISNNTASVDLNGSTLMGVKVVTCEKGYSTAYVAMPMYGYTAKLINTEASASTEYTITFDLTNGGALPNGTENTATTTDGKLATLPEPTYDGYTFGGWYTDATKGTKVTTDTTFDDNATIYAQWYDDEVSSTKPVSFLETVQLIDVSGDDSETKFEFSGIPELSQAEIDAGFKYVYVTAPDLNATNIAALKNQNFNDGVYNRNDLMFDPTLTNDIPDNLQIELDTLSIVLFMKVNTNKTFNGKYHIFAEKDFAAGKAAASTGISEITAITITPDITATKLTVDAELPTFSVTSYSYMDGNDAASDNWFTGDVWYTGENGPETWFDGDTVEDGKNYYYVLGIHAPTGKTFDVNSLVLPTGWALYTTLSSEDEIYVYYNVPVEAAAPFEYPEIIQDISNDVTIDMPDYRTHIRVEVPECEEYDYYCHIAGFNNGDQAEFFKDLLSQIGKPAQQNPDCTQDNKITDDIAGSDTARIDLDNCPYRYILVSVFAAKDVNGTGTVTVYGYTSKLLDFYSPIEVNYTDIVNGKVTKLYVGDKIVLDSNVSTYGLYYAWEGSTDYVGSSDIISGSSTPLKLEVPASYSGITASAYWTVADSSFSNQVFNIKLQSDTANGYTITLDPNGGSLTGETTVTTNANGLIDAYPDEPTREGYTFGGWYTDPVKGEALGIATKFDSNATLYAQWLDEVGDNSENKRYITYLENVKLEPVTSDTTGTKYVFTGIPELSQAEIDAGFKYIYSVYPSEGEYTKKELESLAAETNNGVKNKEYDRYTYLVGLSEMQDIPTDNTITVTTLSAVTLCKISDNSHKYVDGFGEECYNIFAEKYFVVGNEAASTEYTITLKYQDDKTADTTAETENGKLTSLPTPTRDGYTFKGWFDAETDGNEVTTATVFDKNTTIYAQWEKNVVYPALPKVTATAGENSVSLKWTAVDGAASYRVFYRVSGTKIWTTKNTTTTSVTISDLTGGTKYDFLVLAYDGTNWSKYTSSDIINATPKTAAPAAPAKPVFTVTAGEESVTVKWTAVSGATSYRVFYRVNGTEKWATKNTTGTALTVTDLTNGTKYDLLVRAYNGKAWSAYTDADIKTATPKAAVGPALPTISSITPYENSAVIRWTASNGATSYRVYYRINGTTKWSYRNTTQKAMVLWDLTGGKKYDILVCAYNGKAWSAYTAQDIKNVVPVKATPKPTITSATPGKNSVTVKWTAVSGAKSYRVFYRVKGTSKWLNVNTTRTQAAISGLTGGKTYEILVRSYSASGWSSYSPKDYAEAEING